MSGSDPSRLECGCGKELLFGFQLADVGMKSPDGTFSEAKLFHSDGTAMCSVPEPKVLPRAYAGTIYVPGRVGAVSPALRTYVDPPEERERDRPPFTGVVILIAFLSSVVALCGLAFYVWWTP